MKRSEINRALRELEQMCRQEHCYLPLFCSFAPQQWQEAGYGNQNVCGYMPTLNGLKVLDTCGAGDIFGGSAVQCILNTGKQPNELSGDELRQIAGFATAAAGLSTERSGGISSIPSLEEIRKRILE